MSDRYKINLYIVSIYYPPVISVATNRIFAFAKYFNKSRFNVTVLTLSDSKSETIDENPDGVKVIRLKNDMLFRKVSYKKPAPFFIHKLKVLYNVTLSSIVQNEYRSWGEKTVKELHSLINNKEKNVVLSSYNPPAAHLVAYKLKELGDNFLWIADMRDEIINKENYDVARIGFLKKVLKQTVSHADIITSVSKPVLQTFMNEVARPETIFKEIRNGYDFELPTKTDFNKVFTVTFAGTFYGKIKPKVFFIAVLKLLRKGVIEDIHIKFIGTTKNFIIPDSLKNKISFTEKLQYIEAINLMKQSDSLLLILSSFLRKGVFSGKLFDYLGCLKPIIAIVDKNDVAAQLISKCNAGFIAEPDDIEDVENAILSAYKLWKHKETLNYNIDLIKEHHRKNQVLKLEELILEHFDS